MTDTSHETRGFPPIEPIEAPPEMARFMTAMRRLQDIAVSTAPDGAVWTDGATMRGHLSGLKSAETTPARRAGLSAVLSFRLALRLDVLPGLKSGDSNPIPST